MPEEIPPRELDQMRRKLANAYEKHVPHNDAQPGQQAPDWVKGALYLLLAHEDRPGAERLVFTTCNCDQAPGEHTHLLGSPHAVPALASTLNHAAPPS